MEYFEASDLMTHLNGMRLKGKAVPIEAIQVWLGSIVEGVNYLHKNGIVHRNLKPSSFYLKPFNKAPFESMPFNNE